MNFRLIDSGWRGEFEQASQLRADDLLIISPFITRDAAERLTRGGKRVRLLTRFDLNLMRDGICDLNALRDLVKSGAIARGIRHLHSKMYVFGSKRAIVTSANLTEAAVSRNHELGFATDDPALIAECQCYFERLWKRAGKSVTANQLRKWQKLIIRSAGPIWSSSARLPDFGANLGFTSVPPPPTPPVPAVQQAFVKFFGTQVYRAIRDTPIIDLVKGAGSHWALSYPRHKRPRQVQDGDCMFIGHLVKQPHDTLIYGKAIAYAHQPGRDDASAAEIKRTSWKRDWCRYIRVRSAEFISGTLANGVSLNGLMDRFGADAFESTHRNKRTGHGNTDAHKSLMRKAHVRLTRKAGNWLNARIEQEFATHHRLSQSSLKSLYWPKIPAL